MLTNNLTVSVIVPVYNAQRTIEDCLRALLAQDYPAQFLQLLVVDNNSTDGTPDIVRQYPVVLLRETDRQSSYAARNRGIRFADGTIVAFTDADCVPKSDWIAKLCSVFSDPSVVGAAGSVLDAKASNDVERFIAELQPLANAQRLEDSPFMSVVTANAAYRRSTLKGLGGFNQCMYTGGDIDLAWRIQREDLGSIVHVPEATVLHQHRSTLADMYRQFRRYGYSSAILTAMHRSDEAFPRTVAWQKRQVFEQLGALLTYLASLCYRNTVGLFQGRPPYDRKKPAYFLVAEGAVLAGRLAGIWETRGLRDLPLTFRENE